MMKFYLQQGHNMMPLDREFVEKNPGTGVILSPRNYTRVQIERHAIELHDRGADVLFDPQFYQPRTERENILNYPYWDGLEFSTHDFATTGAARLCEGVIEYQIKTLDVSTILLPGRYTNVVSDSWLETHLVFAETASKYRGIKKPILCTLALGPDVVGNRESFDRVLNEITAYPVDGVYLVAKSPSTFLVKDDLFLYNILDAILSISLAGKEVIIGYANQQSLIYAGAGATGLASGNFRNVRAFDPAIFDVHPQPESQRAVWYYDAYTLSEYRLQTLGLAYQRGLAGNFGPLCEYCSSLLNARNPANILWGEREAFRHYLTEIKRQWLSLNDVSRNKRIDAIIDLVVGAQKRLQFLMDRGFQPGERSFVQAFDSTLGALEAIKIDRKFHISLL